MERRDFWIELWRKFGGLFGRGKPIVKDMNMWYCYGGRGD